MSYQSEFSLPAFYHRYMDIAYRDVKSNTDKACIANIFAGRAMDMYIPTVENVDFAIYLYPTKHPSFFDPTVMKVCYNFLILGKVYAINGTAREAFQIAYWISRASRQLLGFASDWGVIIKLMTGNDDYFIPAEEFLKFIHTDQLV